MKVSAILMFASLWLIHIRLSNGEYRFRRMPPPPPGRPPMPPYVKKWYNQNFNRQQNMRPRPQMHNVVLKKPVGPPMQLMQQRPIALPLRQPAPMKPIISQPIWAKQQYLPLPPKHQDKKPFISSPTIPPSEYDFHIQTNQIPNHSNLIKQVDEKGPIHTIPAPNLSLADKPAHIEEVKPSNQHVEIQHSHSYQVTEAIDHQPKKFFIQENQNQTPRTLENNQEELLLTSHDQINQISQQDLLKILQNYPQAQIVDGYFNPQQTNQPQLQQHLLQQQNGAPYQALITQTQFYQPESAYLAPQREINPEYHSFNYEEPVHKNAAEYSLQPQQNFYNPTIGDNHVEQAINFESVNLDNYPELKTEILTGNYYSSLPNKEAAESLAALQEAGQQRNVNGGDDKMTIYVPDDGEEKKQSEAQYKQQNDDKLDSYEYEDSSMEEDMSTESEATFGSRIKPKTA